MEEAKLDENKLTFKITFERDGQKFPINFEGTIKGDTIDGKVKLEFNGEAREFDWKAHRTLEREDVAGKWEFTIPREQREDIKFHIEFKAKGEKLTGAATTLDGKVIELEEVTIKGTTLTFQVTRTEGDRKITTKVECKPRGDRLTGTLEHKRDGETRTVKLNAKRISAEKKEAKTEEKKDGN